MDSNDNASRRICCSRQREYTAHAGRHLRTRRRRIRHVVIVVDEKFHFDRATLWLPAVALHGMSTVFVFSDRQALSFFSGGCFCFDGVIISRAREQEFFWENCGFRAASSYVRRLSDDVQTTFRRRSDDAAAVPCSPVLDVYLADAGGGCPSAVTDLEKLN